ncbi:hypothetical protein BT69DRAFT_1250382 [Atractiella rhizophila]|nr:hypothetical protein BT69DRAFT_1250382 [Atractiella rhizophila]
MDRRRSSEKKKTNEKPQGRSATAREAKGLAMDFKEILKKKEPMDREVEFQRQNLRKQYMLLIFSSFESSKPLEVLHLLWLETSHAIIQLYRDRLAAVDAAMKQPRGKPPHYQPGQQQFGPVARRKLFQNFRNFLNSEESFWRDQLLVKMVREWDLKEAEPALRALGVVFAPDDSGPLVGPVLSVSRVPVVPPASQVTEKDGKNAEILKLAHDRALNVCQKALICYGDLTRYRELYSDPAAEKRNGRNGRSGKTQVKREATYIRASECYTQARLLLPDNGNPSNQLAVLSSYAGDSLGSIYHYYRALCAQEPFSTARNNLQVTYRKALNKAEQSIGNKNQVMEEPRRFEVEFIQFHAMLFLNEKLGAAAMKMDALAKMFGSALKERALLADTVLKVVVTALCAFHNSRLTHSASLSSPALDSEFIARDHALLLFKEMFDLASEETMECLDIPSPLLSEDEPLSLAQRISAPLRRMLPALRIVSKWTMAHLDYLSRTNSAILTQFWSSYCNFNNALKSPFPLETVPLDEEAMLEEDVEMLGFSPLKRGLRDRGGYVTGKNGRLVRKAGGNVERRDMHPNEEQLIRIKDLQNDVKLIAESKASPILESDGRFLKASEATSPSAENDMRQLDAVAAEFLSRVFDPSVMETIEETSEHSVEGEAILEDASNDDVVDLAMRIGTGHGGSESEEEEEDDEVLYPYKMSIDSVSGPATVVPPSPTNKESVQAKNAFDLLSQVLGGGALSAKDVPSLPSRPLSNPNIWAPTNQFQFNDDVYASTRGATGWPQFAKNRQFSPYGQNQKQYLNSG